MVVELQTLLAKFSVRTAAATSYTLSMVDRYFNTSERRKKKHARDFYYILGKYIFNK